MPVGQKSVRLCLQSEAGNLVSPHKHLHILLVFSATTSFVWVASNACEHFAQMTLLWAFICGMMAWHMWTRKHHFALLWDSCNRSLKTEVRNDAHMVCIFGCTWNFGCVVEACCGAAVRLAVQKGMFKFELDRRLPALLTGPMCDWLWLVLFFFRQLLLKKLMLKFRLICSGASMRWCLVPAAWLDKT